MSAGGSVEAALRGVEPGRYDRYERLLAALAGGAPVWVLLWGGGSGAPDAQYASLEADGQRYVPCASSAGRLAASGWHRPHEVVPATELAAALYPGHWGLWLDPHAPGGGVGVPWLDLRRVARGLAEAPAGPLRLSEPALELDRFYALLGQHAHRTPAVRALRRAWVQPAFGDAYLAIGVDLYDVSPASAEAGTAMLRQTLGAAPEGLAVAHVAMSDDHDPVAMWMRACARPFFDRDAHGGGVPHPAQAPAYGYPRPL